MEAPNDNIKGILFLLLAIFVLSLQDVAIKWIGGGYPVMEIVIFRNLVAVPATLVLFRLEGGRGRPTTNRPRLEYARGVALFLSFTTYMMGLAALPLADVAAIRNAGPLFITFLSVVLLGETVGPRRWLMLLVGFAGVLLIIQPGATTFNLGSVFIVLATLFYALNVIITRQLRATESSATMAYFSSLVYLVAGLALAPLALFIGERPDAHESIAFLFRAWAAPSLIDGAIMCGLGLVWASGMYFIARAYSLAQASVAAPFEYAGLLISVFWGFAIWGEIPTVMTGVGALLTVASGLYILWRSGSAARVVGGESGRELE